MRHEMRLHPIYATFVDVLVLVSAFKVVFVSESIIVHVVQAEQCTRRKKLYRQNYLSILIPLHTMQAFFFD